MELKPAHKLTDVGIIPEDWEVRAVGCMGQVITGKALAVNAPGTHRPYLRTKNVFDGRIDLEDVLTMPMTDAQFSQFVLKPGDVLLNEGQSLGLVGRCALYDGEYPEPCAIQNQLLRFRARSGVSGVFASHLFRYAQHTGVFAKVALQTTSIAHLGGKRFEQLCLAWPAAHEEQETIAKVLGDVDALLLGLERLIAKKRDLKQAAMQQLLTGQTRLPGFSDEWRMNQFGNLAFVRNQKVDPIVVNPSTLCVELEHIGQDNGLLVSSSTAQSSTSAKYRFCVGDVLFGRLRSYLRKHWFANQDGICSTEIWPLVAHLDEVDRKFLSVLVQSDVFITAASISYGTHMPRADWKIISALEVLIPSLEEQVHIAAVLSEMDAELSALEARRDKTRVLKQAMMQELLTGRTRLV